MSNSRDSTKKPPKEKKQKEKNSPDYPPYPKREDIYEKDDKKEDIDPANPSQDKSQLPNSQGKARSKKTDRERMGGDLDIPGEELDDRKERKGEEDEENNYYSLDSDVEEKDRDAEK